MADFLNKLEISDQKYQTNGNVRDENSKGKILFLIKEFVSFRTDCQVVYFMSTKFLKKRSMKSGFHNFNFVTLATQLVFHIKDQLICVVNYIICGGEINIWNYRSGWIA